MMQIENEKQFHPPGWGLFIRRRRSSRENRRKFTSLGEPEFKSSCQR